VIVHLRDQLRQLGLEQIKILGRDAFLDFAQVHAVDVFEQDVAEGIVEVADFPAIDFRHRHAAAF
jgi:hypothetical protein